MVLVNTSRISRKPAGSSRLVLDEHLNDHTADDSCSQHACAALDTDEAFDALSALDAQAYLAEAYCLAAESDLHVGDAAAAQCRAERALKAAKRVDRPTCIVWAYALLARAAIELGHRDEARSHVDAALPLLETEPYPAFHARTRIAAAAELLE